MSTPSTLPTDVPRVMPRLVRPEVSAKRNTPTNEMKMIQKTIFADPRNACSTEGTGCGEVERSSQKIYPAALHKIKPRYDFRLTSIVRRVYLAASRRPGPGAVPLRALHGRQHRPDRRSSSTIR